jgi:hypothetical protein
VRDVELSIVGRRATRRRTEPSWREEPGGLEHPVAVPSSLRHIRASEEKAMPRESQPQAAEHHEKAAKSHKSAAESHDKGDAAAGAKFHRGSWPFHQGA